MDTPTNSHFRRRFCWAPLSAVTLIGLSIAFVDRPASTWVHETFHGVVVFPWLPWLVDSILPMAMAGLAVVWLAVTGFAAGLGWRPGARSKTLIACCLAVIIAFVMKEGLKLVFGRTWPETWLDNNPS